MKDRFEKLIDFILKKQTFTGKTRVLFLDADQWKALAKEKNDLAIYYEELTKKSLNFSGGMKEMKNHIDYSTSFVISVKEPQKRFPNLSSKQKFPQMGQMCLVNRDVDLLILINPNEFPKRSLKAQCETIAQELLHYEEHKTGQLYPPHQIQEKAKKIVEEFLKQVS